MALLHVDYHSHVLGMAMQMDVILPQRPYNTVSKSEDVKYPVLYLLHGMSDDHTMWQRRTSIERYATEYNMAVVMPNGHISWYSDMYHGGKYFTHLTEELPAVVHDLFPRISTKREDTFIGGNSMGGHGALKLALRKPELYSAAISLSGALEMRPKNGKFGINDNIELWTNIFGPAEAFVGSENDITFLAEKLAPCDVKPRVFMWCGTEDFLYSQNISMRGTLESLGYDINYTECEGNHSWTYWDLHIRDGIKWFFEGRK